MAAISLATLVVTIGQLAVMHVEQNIVFSRLVAELALRAHVDDSAALRALYPITSHLTDLANLAEAARISIFAPHQPDYLVPPAHIVATSKCNGFIDEIAATASPGVYRATGWIFDETRQDVPHSVIVSDASGVTLGTGVTGAS